MTKEDITRMAREAGGHASGFNDRWAMYTQDLERFAALVAAEKDKEIERLREALHRISLASQNSMSSKDECGRIARSMVE